MNVERDLIDADFEGYKLSLDSVPCFMTKLPNLIKPRLPNDEQFSFHHAKLFGKHNVLVQDMYCCGARSGYVLDQHRIFLVLDKSEEGSPSELIQVWSSPEDQSQAYNSSLAFADPDHAIFADGQGSLFVIKTGDRNSSENWTTIFQDQVCGLNSPFVVADAKNNDVLLIKVEDKSKIEGLKSENANNFVNVVEWLTFDAEFSKLDRVRRFAFMGEIELLELSGQGILYFGEHKPFELLFDSSGMPEQEAEEAVEKKEEEKPPAFYWLQGVEDMAVWVMLPEGTSKKDIKVVLKPSHMTVKVKDRIIMDGKLWNVLDTDSMTWTIDTKKNKLEITMCKANNGLMWQRFLAASDNLIDGEEVMDAAMVEKIHEQLSHLTSSELNPDPAKPVYNNQELEACDDSTEVSRVLMHVQSLPADAPKVLVGECQYLFSSKGSDLNSTLCLRHDVDGLMWQPRVLENHELKMEHVDTFNALGYVQASKNQRRFSVSAPDRSYAAIVDRARHVYIYRKPEPISAGCELRNRKSGQKVQKVAKQQVPTLEHDPSDFIVGAVASNACLYVATTSSLFTLKIK